MDNELKLLIGLTLDDTELEEKVQNLFSKKYNLNIGMSNYGTVYKQLGKLQTRLEKLSKMSVNINTSAALTAEQQQYRLETQRLAVLQRIQLAQERTAQTENQAIAALAQENRTLNANLNIQQRISGEVQHTHQRLNAATQQTQRFNSRLAQSLKTLMAYRALNYVASSISDAYKELKNMDAEMVEIRKVTGATALEMERISKSALQAGKNYGRAASEYLSSVSSYSKAGYGSKSQQLGELSLLAENVGDIDNDLANQFLISADAAWKYQGDIQKLTAILDGFNELSNRTATTTGDLADGIRVAGSVFAQAGLSAQDYSALVGTAQAKTQESGAVVARALRTVLMNIRQIRGTDLETGEIIDESKLAKAEAALNAIGISVREEINGINELRNPMLVLDELAAKWNNLSSVQQAAVQEALANKRQSNIFTSVMENWEDVSKAADIYANSAGSAMRENEIYLDSWNAKLEQLKAAWTSYIGGLQETSTIKNTLQALTNTIGLLDSDFGRFTTKFLLFLAVMKGAKSSFAWIKTLETFKKLNLEAELIKQIYAMNGFSAAARATASALWETAAAWAATPMGMVTITVGAIIALNQAIDSHNQKLKEQRQNMIDSAETAANEAKNLSELTDKYFELTEAVKSDASQKDNLISVQNELLAALGLERQTIDELVQKYGSLDDAIKQVSIDTLKGKETDLMSGVVAAREALVKNNVGDWTDMGVTGMNSDGKIVNLFPVRSYDSADDVIAKYELAADMMKAYQESSGKTVEELVNDGYYKMLSDYYKQLTADVQALRDAEADYNSVLAQIAVYENDSQIPQTAEEFKAYQSELIKAAQSNSEFIGTEEDVAKAINTVLMAMPQYKQFFTDIAETVEESTDTIKSSLNDKFTDLENTGLINGIKAIKDAMDDLDEKGAVDYTNIFNNSSSESKQGIIQLLGEAVDNIDDYISKITDMSASIDERKQALVDLTQAYINALVAEGNFADGDENMIATVLNEAGVLNSTAVAHDMVTQAKIQNAAASVDLNDTTGESIAKFEDEVTALGLTETAVSSLSAAFANAQNIMTIAENTGAITRLKQLGIELQAIQGVADAYNALGQARYVGSEKSRARWRVENGYGSDLENAVLGIGDARENINKLIADLSKTSTTPTFKPSDKATKSAKSAKDTFDKIKDYNKQLDDLAKSEALQKIKHKCDTLEQSITKVDNALSLLDATMELQAEDDYIGRLETVTRQLDLAHSKSALLRDEFTKLKSEQATTGDVANELATRMKSVADSIASNSKNIMEYGKNMTEYYMSAMTSISSMSQETIDKATSLFERNVKTLAEGGLTGLQFTLSPDVPQSAYEIQRKENEKLEAEMQSYYDTVAAMQKTALDMQYQEQLADNERKRQELYSSINDATSTVQSAATTVQTIQKNTNAATSKEQKKR